MVVSQILQRIFLCSNEWTFIKIWRYCYESVCNHIFPGPKCICKNSHRFWATGWRLLIMPNDACKSHLQIHGKEGLSILRNKIRNNGMPVLWNGGAAAISANFVGHYPWFLTYNYLQENMPRFNDKRDMLRSMSWFL